MDSKGKRDVREMLTFGNLRNKGFVSDKNKAGGRSQDSGERQAHGAKLTADGKRTRRRETGVGWLKAQGATPKDATTLGPNDPRTQRQIECRIQA